MSALLGLCVAAAIVVAGGAVRPLAGTRPLTPLRRRQPRSPSVGLATNTRVVEVVVVVIVVGLAAAAAGPVLAATGICLAMLGRRRSALRAVARRRRRIDAAYPDALDLVVLAVRSGFLPAAAVAATTPHLPAELRSAFAAVSARVADGDRFGEALAALDELGPVARPLIDTFAAADRYGLALAPVLERLALDARQQRRRAADAFARQLPVRLSLPLVLCTLPSFVLLAIVPLLLGAFSSLHTP